VPVDRPSPRPSLTVRPFRGWRFTDGLEQTYLPPTSPDAVAPLVALLDEPALAGSAVRALGVDVGRGRWNASEYIPGLVPRSIGDGEGEVLCGRRAQRLKDRPDMGYPSPCVSPSPRAP